MQLQFESKDDVPVELAESVVEFEEDGKQVWMHKDLAESKKTAFRYKGQASKLTTDFDQFKSKISANEQAAVEKAKAERDAEYAEKMAKLKDDGKHSEVHKLEMQQLMDRNSSIETNFQDLQSKYEELQNSLVEKSNFNMANEIASQFVPPELTKSFSKLLVMDGHIKNVDGQPFFVNASGEAVDGDMSRIIEVLKNDPELKHYAKFPGSNGGLGGDGGSKHVEGKTISRKAFESKSPNEKASLMKSGVKIID